MNRLSLTIGLAALAFSTQILANDVDPFGFEKEHFISTRSRAEVVAELRAAQASGQTLVAGEIGERVIETPSVKTRAQVAAETAEAKRLGLISYGEADQKLATPAQERQIEMAGLRALERTATARR